MKIKEAISRLKGKRLAAEGNKEYCDHPSLIENFERDAEAFQMAIEALEKQIPKMPKWHYDGELRMLVGCTCESCGEELDTENKTDFCLYCGQELDWSDAYE